jgi:competence ComEA-like helix-hairpin-helix protein
MKMKAIACCMAALVLSMVLAGPVSAAEEGKLNLNAATVEELTKIPGLNKSLAQKIVELRQKNGEFIDMEELLDIKGIDNRLLRQLKQHLYIEPVDDCNC